MSTVVRFDRARLQDVRVDTDGYVVLSLTAWHHYAPLFSRHGIDVDKALDTLEDFHNALSRCATESATVHRLSRGRA